MPETLTLYTAKICPYAHRVELALEEAKANYDKYQIDLSNKPSWYAPKVNPASKVPAIAYGGPKVLADQPSPESAKIAESLVLLEFVAELYPQSNLLPSDPINRARVRLFIETAGSKLTSGWLGYFRGGKPEDKENFLNAVEYFQNQLSPEGFAFGEYSNADIAVAPFIARSKVALKNEVGAYPEGEGKQVLHELAQPRFARFQKYWSDLQSRPNFQATFDEAYVAKAYKEKFGGLRAQKL